MTKHIELAIADLVQKRHSLPYVRSNSIDDIAKQIKNTFSGVFLIEGAPGIGKSASLGPIADVVGAHNPERIISYYFSLTNPVLNNADNFYEYSCKKIKAITGVPTAEQETVSTEGARKDHIDFQHALAELGEFIGNDVERRIYFFIDGIEEIQDHKEFLGRLPFIDGVVYVLFAQPGICDRTLPENFYERGRLKNRAEIKYLEKSHAESFFWEVYGKDLDSEADEFEERISKHLTAYLKTETNRFPLLLKVLAEDARDDGFNPDRAWANGLQDYVDSRISALSDNARNLLILVSLALGPLQGEDLCEMMGNLSRAIYETALKEAERFLVINIQGITISHNVWAKLISKRWANKSSYRVYLNWCANWSNPRLRKDTAEYIARYYVLHILSYVKIQSDWTETAKTLLLELYKDNRYVEFQGKTLFPNDGTFTGIISLTKKAFSWIASFSKPDESTFSLILALMRTVGDLEGARRRDFKGEGQRLFKNFCDKPNNSEAVTGMVDIICSAYGIDFAGKHGLLPLEEDNEDWSARARVCYFLSDKSFRENQTEASIMLIYIAVMTCAGKCLEEDLDYVRSGILPREIRSVYKIFRIWLNILVGLLKWKEQLQVFGDAVKLAEVSEKTLIPNIKILLGTINTSAETILKNKTDITNADSELLNRITSLDFEHQ